MSELEAPAAGDAAPESETPVEQVSQPVEADATEPTAEQDKQQNQQVLDEQRATQEKRARGVQKRLDELTREKYEANARAERMEAMVRQLMERNQPQQQPQQPAEPRQDQFTSYDDFVAAKAEWRAEQKAAKLLEERLGNLSRTQQQMAAQERANQVRAEFERKQTEFAKTKPDYFDVLQGASDVNIPEASVAILHTMDDGPAVAYYLAQNPDTAARLQQANPLLQATLLGQISARLATPPQPSKAPPPGKPAGVKPQSTGGPPEGDDAYWDWREKQIRGK